MWTLLGLLHFSITEAETPSYKMKTHHDLVPDALGLEAEGVVGGVLARLLAERPQRQVDLTQDMNKNIKNNLYML